MEQGKIMEAEVPTVRVGTTPTGLTAPHPHNPPRFITGRMPFLPPNQQRQSTEGTSAEKGWDFIIFAVPGRNTLDYLLTYLLNDFTVCVVAVVAINTAVLKQCRT